MSTPKSNPTVAPDIDAPVRGPSKLPLILLGVLVMGNLAGTGAIAMRVMRPPPSKEQIAKEAAEKKPSDAPGPVVALDTFVVNLNEPASSRYLKVTFELEVADVATQKDVEEHRRALRDELLRYLSNLSVKDTLGEAGKAKIKDDLVARADKAIGGTGKIRHLFFTEFVVQ